MRVGIDGFCYHRWFGQAYPGLEEVPAEPMTVLDVVHKAAELGAHGVAVESFMLPDDPAAAAADAARVAGAASDAGLDLMWSWGHPDGLGSGSRPEALHDLRRHAELAAAHGVPVMRICAGGRRTRPAEWGVHRRALLPLLTEAAQYASDLGLVLAVENHADLLADELAELITIVDSPSLGVCLDTANNLRMLEDPDRAIDVLAPFARAVHLKDVQAHRGDPKTFSFWPSVPLGDGVIDIGRLLVLLDRLDFTGLLAIEIDYLHPRYRDEGIDEDEALEQSIGMVRAGLDGIRAGKELRGKFRGR